MSIYDQVHSFIAAPDRAKFDELALEVFRYQVANVAAYRELCRTVGAREDSIARVEDIPPVSTLAFKYARLAGDQDSAKERIFFTSGTTIGRSERGNHIVGHPEIYRASALAHLRAMIFPDGRKLRILAMHPTADRMPESSLSQMISWCIEEFGAGRCECAADRKNVDTQAACNFLKDAERNRAPVCILGTTASLGALFAHLERIGDRIALAPGSRIMDTGGAKGQVIPLNTEMVCARAAEMLGIAPSLVINEYGMTELCSQLYDATSFNSNDDSALGQRVKVAPPWMRAAAVDPVSLKTVPCGAVGMLRFFDLANVGSVSAILTEDFGIVNERGDRVRVLGRAGVGEPRGCALAIQEFEGAEKSAPTMTEAPRLDSRAEANAVREGIARLRQNHTRPASAARVADALASTFDRWRERGFPERRNAIAQIATASGWSPQLVDESIDALLAPFSRETLTSFASRIMPRAQLGGFIMPANVPGAGVHELVAALISGAAAIVKTSNREPVLFHAFIHTLREIDPAIGTLLEVTTFGRERDDLGRLMIHECDFIVALGDDASLAHLAGVGRFFGFGSRTSGAVISLAAPANLSALASSLARDIALFEQQGCLSPHHIFIENADPADARGFVASLADALTSLAVTLPPPKLSFHTAAAIRRIRERARWRGIGGHHVELFEGANMAWTVVLEPSARFTISPGFRTVTISSIRDADDLASRLEPVAGRLEAFALAAPASSRARFLDVLAGAGVTYVCDPGKMQSPPLNWPHGGGAFLDFLAAR